MGDMITHIENHLSSVAAIKTCHPIKITGLRITQGGILSAFALCILLIPGLIQAQSSTLLVGNIGQGNTQNLNATSDVAQRFTTGNNPSGYTVTSVEVVSDDPQGDDFTVSICEVDNSGFRVSSTCERLTSPSSFAAGTLTFTASPGIELEPGTTYTVLMDVPTGDIVAIVRTTSTTEDAGSLPGWSINNQYDQFSLSSSPQAWQTITHQLSRASFRVNLKGFINPPTITSITRQNPTSTPVMADSLTWRVTFSQAVENVDAGDFTLEGTSATLSVQELTGETGVWDVTASAGDLSGISGTVTLSLASDQDITSEAGILLTDPIPTDINENSYQIDNLGPTVTIEGVPEERTNNNAFRATITFSEPVTGFTQSDITLENATVSLFGEISSAPPQTSWFVQVTPTANGEAAIGLAAEVAEDALGNGNQAARAVSGYRMPDDDLWSANLTVQQSFSNQYGCLSFGSDSCSNTRVLTDNDFDIDGVTYEVRSISLMSGTLNITIQPALPADLTAENLVVTVEPHRLNVRREEGSGRTTLIREKTGFSWGEDNVIGLKISRGVPPPQDTTPPTVAITDVPTTSDSPFTATITFSEPVTGFTQGDITVTNATLSNLTQTVVGTTWTVLVTPILDESVTLDIEQDVARDAGLNGNTAATQVTSTYTAPPPEIEIVGRGQVTEGEDARFTLSRTGRTTEALTVFLGGNRQRQRHLGFSYLLK